MNSKIEKLLDELKVELTRLGNIEFESTYGIKVKVDENFTLLDYSMTDVDWDFKPSILCRGLILDSITLNPVCFPLSKFWNFNEGRAANIDWSNAKVVEKVDGTMVCRWWNEYIQEFVYTTRRQLPNDTKSLELPGYNLTWKTLFDKCLNNVIPDIKQSKDETLVFEAMSIANRVVVIHNGFHGRLLGKRNNLTFLEEDISAHKWAPNQFDLSSINSCQEYVETLSGLKSEGVVVVDKDFNRVKIKGRDYQALHHLKDTAGQSFKSMILVVRRGECGEVGAAFPEFIPTLNSISSIVANWTNEHITAYEKFKAIESQKEFAIAIQKAGVLNTGLLFMTRAGKYKSVNDAIEGVGDSQYINYIKPIIEGMGLSLIQI